MKKLNIKSNRGAISLLLLATMAGTAVVGYQTTKNKTAIGHLNDSYAPIAQQVSQNSRDVDALGRYISYEPWNTQTMSERQEADTPKPTYNWRSNIPAGCFGPGGLGGRK